MTDYPSTDPVWEIQDWKDENDAPAKYLDAKAERQREEDAAYGVENSQDRRVMVTQKLVMDANSLEGFCERFNDLCSSLGVTNLGGTTEELLP